MREHPAPDLSSLARSSATKDNIALPPRCMDERETLARLTQWIYSLSTQYGHDIKHERVRWTLIQAFYDFALGETADRSSYHIADLDVTKLDGAFKLSEAQDVKGQDETGKRCGHIFDRGEAVYRCRDCGIDDTCVLCSRCFDADAHAGHNVSYTVHDSNCGCCDCGDSEAWNRSFACPAHHHAGAPTPQRDLPDDAVVRIISMLDLIIESAHHAPEILLPPRSAQHVRKLALPPDPKEPAKRQFDRDAPGPWACILWNDEKHNFAQVIDQVCRAIPSATKATAAATAITVDSHGRDTVLISTNSDALYSAAQIIGSIDLAVTVRPAQLNFCEEVAGVFVEFLLDLCSSRYLDDANAFARTVATALLATLPHRRGGELMRIPMTRFERLLTLDIRLWKQARLQLRELYVRLLLVSDPVRAEMGRQYCRMYPMLVDAFLLGDREPDNSVISFGVQILSVPSVVHRLLCPVEDERNFIDVLVDILIAFFTEQVSDPGMIRLPRRLLAPDPSIQTVDADSPAFKHKRYFHVLHDLGRLFSSPAAKTALPEDPHRIDGLIRFLDLFTNMHLCTRAVGQHVEYESDTWITAFNATIQIGRLARMCGEAFREAPAKPLQEVMFTILKAMQRVAIPKTSDHAAEVQRWQGRKYRLLKFTVSKDPISFHHPLQWLYAELAKNIDAMDEAALQRAGFANLTEFVLGDEEVADLRYTRFLFSIEVPLQICALLAQVRAGVWVRNGFTMRIQSMHYREYNLREMTHDQDVYLLQFFMSVHGADTLLIAMLARFELVNWLQADVKTDTPHPAYTSAHCLSVLDDLIALLVNILGETSLAAGWSTERRLRRDIIHALAVGQCTLSELTKRVSELFQEDPAFERILLTVATYRPPASTNDFGVYSLKPELLAEVDPYYFRYTRNQRDDARKAVHAQMAREGIPLKDRVIVPRPYDITYGPHKGQLVKTFATDSFVELVFHAMRRASEPEEPNQTRFSEAVVDGCVHLIMLALVNETRGTFVVKATRQAMVVPAGAPNGLVELLAQLEVDGRLESVRPRLRWILDQLAEVDPDLLAELRQRPVTSPSLPIDDGKKAAAKARQVALMSQFAQMQQTFMNSELAAALDDEDSDGEDAMDEGMAAKKSLGDCIVCQEALDALKDPFGMLGLIQSSRFLRHVRLVSPHTGEADLADLLRDIPNDFDQASEAPMEMSDGIPKPITVPVQPGLHASSCGHMMHIRCFEQYYRSVETRHNAQAHRNHPENIDRREYICPLCKSLGNVLLPITESIDNRDDAPPEQTLAQTAEWVETWVDQAVQGWPAHGGRSINRMLATGGTGELTAWMIDEEVQRRRSNEPLLHISEAERSMYQRVVGVAYPLSVENHAEDLDALLYLPEELIGYTVKCLEVAQRGQRHDVVDLTESSTRTLRGLFGVLRGLVDMAAGSVQGTEYAAVAIASRMAARDRAGSKFPTSCSLALLVAAAAVNPSSFAHFSTLMYYDELALLLARLLFHDEVRRRRGRAGTSGAGAKAIDRYRLLADLGRFFLVRVTGNKTELLHGDLLQLLGGILHHFTLPVLRQIALVRRLAFSDEGEQARWRSVPSELDSEYSRLLWYTGIPDGSVMMTAQDAEPLRQRFDRLVHLYLSPYAEDPSIVDRDRFSLALPEYPAIYRLIALPRRLDKLLSDLHRSKCMRCKTTPADPALCLLCGTLVCNQTFCCMDASDEDEPIHGECNTHMWSCGGSIGVYFLVNKPSILYLYADNGSFAASPYLDEHGEVANKRNLFKFLHGPRYEDIRRNWQTHAIPTFVARKLDSLVDPGGWTTL